MGLEQFVSYDPDDPDSIAAAHQHMEDAVKDAASIGYPPGKEGMYLQMGWSDERSGAALESCAAAGRLPLPGEDQGGVRPQRRGGPHVSDACRSIPARTAPVSGKRAGHG